jgi:hypothetical protein
VDRSNAADTLWLIIVRCQTSEPSPRIATHQHPDPPLRPWKVRPRTRALPSSIELLPPEQMLLLDQPFTRHDAIQHGLSKDVLDGA